MKAQKVIPPASAIGREALIVVGGAILAALIIGRFPGVKAWIRRQWEP